MYAENILHFALVDCFKYLATNELSSNDFYIRAFNLFNSLPAVIKNKFSLSLFKSRAKEHFYEIYCDVHELN